MPNALTTYRVLTSGAFYLLFPAFYMYAGITGKHREGLSQRLGRHGRSSAAAGRNPRIWLHAASVGEVGVAAPIIDALETLLPESRLTLSTTTHTGHSVAVQRLGERVRCVYAPVDISSAVRRSLTALAPDALVCLETELWPNLLFTAHRMRIPVALVNGRISVRSYRRYLKARPLMRQVLAAIDAFSMIGADDAQRIRRMGAPARRVMVNGNAKFDGLAAEPAVSPETLARWFDIAPGQPVWVAGSTRADEEALLLDAFEAVRRQIPDALLILAPRHVTRSSVIARLAAAKGMPCQLRSDLGAAGSSRSAPVVVLDTMGELRAVYRIADVVFCGGSLVPKGGQNVLEAAMWGKPVLFGPHMEDFTEARDLLLASGGGIEVSDRADVAARLLDLFRHPDRAQSTGAAGRRAVMANAGAARRHAETICQLLPGWKENAVS